MPAAFFPPASPLQARQGCVPEACLRAVSYLSVSLVSLVESPVKLKNSDQLNLVVDFKDLSWPKILLKK